MVADELRLREQICEVGRIMWTKGMVASNDGNLSVRLDADRVLCTPTGVSKGFMTPEMLAVVDLAGTPVPGCEARPSSEIRMHLRVYKEDEGVQAVVHAHPVHATLLAARGKGLVNRMLPEVVVGMGEVPLAPYATPSTAAVADSVAPFVRRGVACLLENHGALTWGPDLMSAYFHMERLEHCAHIDWAMSLVGGGNDLPDEEIARLQAMRG